jgi:predicted Zn-dependent peptidase
MNQHRPIASLLALAALLLASYAASAQELQLDLKRKVLDNGVTVLVWERPSSGRIGTRVFYRVDVAAERPGTAGLTHMLEHYLFKGSDVAGAFDWAKEREVAERIERLSREVTDEQNRRRDCMRQREVFAEVEKDCDDEALGRLRAQLEEAVRQQDALSDPAWYDWLVQSAGGTNSTASTGRDWMKFDIDLPANKLELFMWTERSRVEHPVFRQFEAEREVVVDQIRRGDNRPDGRFDRVLTSMTYDAHPYGWAHWFSDLTRATREDHWEIFHKYFIPQNTILVVVGEVEAEKVFAMAETYWGDWQMGRPSPRLRTVEPPPVGEKRLSMSAAAGPALAVHVRMPAVGHPDAPAFEVLAEVLGGRQGLLRRVLVDERRIATAARAAAPVSKYPSHLALRVEARGNADLEAVEAGIEHVLDLVAQQKVAAPEVEAAAGRLVLRLARQLEEVGDGAVTIGGMEAIHHAGHLNELPGLWRAVTPADLARLVGTYFQPDMRIVGVLRRTEGTATTAGADPAAPPASRGEWAYGGPVGAWLSELQPAWMRKGLAADARGDEALWATRGSPLEGDLGHQAMGAGGVAHAWPTPMAAGAFEAPRAGVEPLAVAESPWFGPPWMAARRPSRFASQAPATRPEDLRFAPRTFEPPDPRGALVLVPHAPSAFVVRDDLLPMAQVTVFVDAPSSADPKGREGLAALTAALVEHGGTVSRARDEVLAALDRMGATLSVSSDERQTRFHLLSPAGGAAEALALLSEMVLRPALAPALEAERERLAVRAARAADDAATRTRMLFDESLYGPTHPVARRATPETVRAVTLDDVRRFHADRYAATRVTFAVSGAVTREMVEAALTNAAAPAEEGAAARTEPLSLAPPQPMTGRRVVTREIDSRQGHVLMGHRGIEGLPEDHAALELMHHVLAGGGFFSRMMRVLRTDTGITAALYGTVAPGRGVVNPYAWRFSGRPDTLARGVRLALDEIARMRDQGVTPQEFEAARTAYLDGLIPASYETPHRTAERFAEQRLFGLYGYQSPQYLNYYAGDGEQAAAIRRLTIDEVNRAARKYLDPDNILIVVTGPLEQVQRGAAPEDRALVTATR